MKRRELTEKEKEIKELIIKFCDRYGYTLEDIDPMKCGKTLYLRIVIKKRLNYSPLIHTQLANCSIVLGEKIETIRGWEHLFDQDYDEFIRSYTNMLGSNENLQS